MALARPIVLGNWKMNGLREDGLALAGALVARMGAAQGTLGIFPPATLLAEIARRTAGSGILVGGQDCHERPAGAFTGSVSAPMLRDAGAAAVILGHSERRHGLGESDALIARKVAAALAAGLDVVLCIGETEAEWDAGERELVLQRQLADSLPAAADPARIIIAYEPVWAIGSGRTPQPADIVTTHRFIRDALARRQGGSAIPVLYGGSVKADNAATLLRLDGVDGALVGGASLDADLSLIHI
jgi:triosephosphate isomerase